MALRATLEALRTGLEQAARTAQDLGDQAEPVKRVTALADSFEEGAEDVRGWLDEGVEAIDATLGSAQSSAHPERLLECLARVHERVLTAGERLGGLLPYERAEQVVRFGEDPDERWRGVWAQQLYESLVGCRGELDAVHRRLLKCWSEFADRNATGLLSIHATNIGQQVTLPPEDPESHVSPEGGERR
jgi:predicted NBD/HSP70 family sugar kinase